MRRPPKNLLLILLGIVIFQLGFIFISTDAIQQLRDMRNRAATTGSFQLPIGKLTISSATASGNDTTDTTSTVNNLFDGDEATYWSAGSAPPQWIQLRLSAEKLISAVRLKIRRDPAGDSTITIYGGTNDTSLTIISTTTQTNNDGDWIIVPISPPKSASVIKIETTTSASWVSWYEVELYSDPGHQVAVRNGINGPELFHKTSQLTFFPRGTNYIRLANVDNPWGGQIFTHSAFNPGKYDRARNLQALKLMKSASMNAVRIILDDNSVGNPSGTGLNPVYITNLSEFLWDAYTQGMYTILTTGFPPKQGGYYVAPPPNFGSLNWHILYIDGLNAKKKYIADLLTALYSKGVPQEALLAVEIHGELTLSPDYPPFSLSTGTVQSTTGTYNMASATDKKKMAVDGVTYYVNQVTQTIKTLDPQLLVTIQFFPADVNYAPDITYLIPEMIQQVMKNPEDGGTPIDFLSLSLYPIWNKTLAELYSDMALPSSRKPVVMLETGSVRDWETVQSGAQKLKNWMEEACAYKVKGWFLWTFDATEQTGPPWWTAIDGNNLLLDTLFKNWAPSCTTATAVYTPTPTMLPTNTPTRTVTKTPTPTPTTSTSVIPNPPSWFAQLPTNMRSFLEQLYLTVYYFQLPSNMSDVLIGIYPTPSVSVTPLPPGDRILPSPPSYWNILPENLRNFIDQLYLTVYYFHLPTNMQNLLEGFI